MKAINKSDVPEFTRRVSKPSKWDFVVETLKAGKVCVIEKHEYEREITVRSGVRTRVEKFGMKCSIRKDLKTGDLYVFLRKP